MIARLRGVLIEKSPTFIVIDVGGVGYAVEIPLSTFEQIPLLNDSITIWIETIVREDALLLYGFASEKERLLFRLLLKVNGVGAKLTLSVLSGLSVEQFVQAIQEKSLSQLQKISGIGKKTAERMILEMAESTQGLGLFATASGQVANRATTATTAPELVMRQQVVQALESLGYKTQEAQQRVEKSWISKSDASGSDQLGNQLSDRMGDQLSDHIKRALQTTL